MPPAILRLTVFSTMLLASSNAALPHENSTRLLEAESTPNWLSLSIDVRPDVNDRPNAGYNMLAVPVLSEGGTKVLYDVSARFDQGPESCIDKSVISYTQTNGYALVAIPSQKEKPTSCLDTSESGRYMIPRINFMLEAVARLEDGDPVAKTPTCNEQYTITLSETDYAVCVTKPRAEMTISGDNMLLTVTYVRDVAEINNGGEATGCRRVSAPFEAKETLGRSLLSPLL